MIGSSSDRLVINNMVSGVQYDQVVKLSLVDYDNQTMLLNNINQITIVPIIRVAVEMKGTNSVILRNGVASFSNLIINTLPGRQDVQLQATSKGIDYTKVKEVYGNTYNNIIYADFRFCKPGEIQQSDNTCSTCAPGTYSLDWNSTLCNL